MREELNETAIEQIRMLCRKIAVAHNLDSEIQEELYGHMEDKALGYLNGEEAVTDEDAAILVCEHFGDPGVLKDLLSEVHTVEEKLSLTRRLGAGLVAYAAVIFGWKLVSTLILLGALLIRGQQNLQSSLIFANFHAYGHFIGMIVTPILFLIVLRKWQQKLDAGQAIWFYNCSPFRIVSTIILLIILTPLIPRIYLFYENLILQQFITITNIRVRIFEISYPFVMVVNPLLWCIAWLWWSDRPPRRIWKLRFGLGMWFVSGVIRVFNMLWLPSIFYMTSAHCERNPSATGDYSPGFNIGSHIFDFQQQSRTLLRYIEPQYIGFIMCIAIVALVLYIAISKLRRVFNRPVQST